MEYSIDKIVQLIYLEFKEPKLVIIYANESMIEIRSDMKVSFKQIESIQNLVEKYTDMNVHDIYVKAGGLIIEIY